MCILVIFIGGIAPKGCVMDYSVKHAPTNPQANPQIEDVHSTPPHSAWGKPRNVDQGTSEQLWTQKQILNGSQIIFIET